MRYQKIESKIWNDEKFSHLTPLQQRLFFYVLTSPHGNILGLFVLKEGYVCEDLKCSAKDFRKDFQKLIDVGLLDYDPSVCLVFIKNFLKHNPITNPNQVKSAERTIQELPRSRLLLMIKGLVKGLDEGLLKGLEEGGSKPSESTSTSESESEREAEALPEAEPERASPSNGDFLSKLKSNPAYSHIDINNELSKMDAWLLIPKNKGRKKTPRFIVNWLNKIEKPLTREQEESEISTPARVMIGGVLKECVKGEWVEVKQ
jgi:hypothetical protein